MAWAILGSSVIDPQNVKWMKGDPAQSYLGWAFFRMEKDWTLPPGYASKLNFPDGTPIAFTDSMPIVAVAMKAISKRLPSTFQYSRARRFRELPASGILWLQDRTRDSQGPVACRSGGGLLHARATFRSTHRFSFFALEPVADPGGSVALSSLRPGTRHRTNDRALVLRSLSFRRGPHSVYCGALRFCRLGNRFACVRQNAPPLAEQDRSVAGAAGGAASFLDAFWILQTGHGSRRVRCAGLSLPLAESCGSLRSAAVPLGSF